MRSVPHTRVAGSPSNTATESALPPRPASTVEEGERLGGRKGEGEREGGRERIS